MSLTIHTEEMEKRQLAMTIEVDEARVTGEMKRVARKLAKDVRIPGFRPGKAPLQVILKRFGEEGVRTQAVEEMLQDVLVEALEESQVEPYVRPTLDDMEISPKVTFKLTIPLAPEVTLGDYRAIRKEIEPVAISEEAVDEAIERLRQSKATTEEVDRPAQAGDLIKIAGKGTIVPVADGDEADANADNVIFDSADGLEFVLDPEVTFAGTGFVDELIGLSTGDQKSFSIRYPDDYEVSDFAGREASFDVTVLNLQVREVPEIDEEFLQSAGFDTVDALREQYREDLETQAGEEQKSKVMEEWIDELSALATLNYPPAAIEEELDESLENLKKQVQSYGWEWSDYVRSQNISENDLREGWREDATRNFERAIVLREFIRAEKLKIGEEELDAMVDTQMSRFGQLDDEMKQAMRNVFLSPEGVQRMANDIMVDKAYERITSILGGSAPDLDALEAGETAGDDENAEAVTGAEAAAGEAPEPALEKEADES